jgi:hypothetical protein
MDATLFWRFPGVSTQGNPQRPPGILPVAMASGHQGGTLVEPPDVVSAAEVEAQILLNADSILRSSWAFSPRRRTTFNRHGHHAPTRCK